MNLTDHFTLKEFEKSGTALRLGIVNRMPDALLPNARHVCSMLELIRAYYDAPLVISSGYRGPTLNGTIGGSKNSDHLRGMAVDFYVIGHSKRGVITDIRRGLIAGLAYKQVIAEFPDAQGECSWIHLAVSLVSDENRAEGLIARHDAGTGRTVYERMG